MRLIHLFETTQKCIVSRRLSTTGKLRVNCLSEYGALAPESCVILMSITIDDGQDPNYLALPDTLKQLVDAAFGSALGGADSHLQPTRDEPMRKRRRIAEQTAESQPGNFIIEN